MSITKTPRKAYGKKKVASLRAQGTHSLENKKSNRKKLSLKEVARIIRELDEKYPIPRNAPRHGIDTTDRHAVSDYIRAQLKRKRSA